MAEESAKLRIPYIAAAQAQKHITHNEAMTLLDTLVQLSVLDKDLATPPVSPAEGDCYIVATSATGAWIGWDKRIARFIDGEWRSYLPGAGSGAGWLAWVIDEAALYSFNGTNWVIAGLQLGSYIDLGEISPPTSPGTDVARLYAKDISGVTKLAFKDHAGTETVLGSGGGSGPGLAHVGIQNGKIVESHNANAATFALKTLAGSDPSAGDPVVATFPDGSQLTITAALSVTVSSGSTLGATNGVAFNVWIALVNNAGAPLLAVRNCSDANGVSGFRPDGTISTTTEGGAGAADSVRTSYAASAVSSKPYLIAAYASYESGLATAGTWNAVPTNIVQFSPGIPKPGDIVQGPLLSSGTPNDTTTNTTYIVTSTTGSITPRSAANLVRVSVLGIAYITASNLQVSLQISRGTSNNTNLIGAEAAVFGASAGTMVLGQFLRALDKPNTSSSQSYALQFKKAGGGAGNAGWGNAQSAIMEIEEIMG